MQKSGIKKEATVHTLLHSFATGRRFGHLLEQGVDIVTIKEQLDHARIETTMIYLHVAKVDKVNAHSPFDKLYGSSKA
jgi:integrase/recombinase XerD